MSAPSIDPASLPSPAALLRASGVALAVLLVLGVAVVLPAEWGVDPTGAGRALGLTAMGELKQAARADAVVVPSPDRGAPREDEITLTIAPGQGLEVKAVMRAGDQLVYDWKTDGGLLFYDFHGEPEGAAADVFTSFETGTRALAEATFDAPFSGVHGWYWKNRTDAPITVVLRTQGTYASIARKP